MNIVSDTMRVAISYQRCSCRSIVKYRSFVSKSVLICVSVLICFVIHGTDGLNVPRLTHARAYTYIHTPVPTHSWEVQRQTNKVARVSMIQSIITDRIIRTSIRRKNKDNVPISVSGAVSRLVMHLNSGSVNDSPSFDRDTAQNRNQNNNGAANNFTKSQTQTQTQTQTKTIGNVSGSSTGMYGSAPNVDAMVARAGKLRQSIREQQLELQRLENQLICCTDNDSNNGIFSSFKLLTNYNNNNNSDNNQVMEATVNRAWRMFGSSTRVLIRKLERVRDKRGPNNQRYDGSLSDYFVTEMATIPRIVSGFVQNPDRIKHLVDPSTPTLIPHVPAILSRLDKLESHVAPILERVLNNRQHLASIEPYLPEILERFDDIEPHLPWILDNIDALAPNTGLLLKHIDELLLYADCKDYSDTNNEQNKQNEQNDDQYALAKQLLPYLEYYVSRLDVIGPHLPLLRPHIPLLLKYNRIGKISPHIDRLFARGYKDLSASVNMDILLFWFGWTLRIKGLPRLFFALPRSPWIVSFLANRLPKRFVRKNCSGVTCFVDNDYGYEWNNLQKDDDN